VAWGALAATFECAERDAHGSGARVSGARAGAARAPHATDRDLGVFLAMDLRLARL